MSIDPALLDFATPRQREVLEAVIEHGSGRAAAKALNVDGTYPSQIHIAVKKKAALQGYSPAHDMTRTVPDGFTVRGVSTYYDSEGKARGQWVKSSADAAARETAVRAMIEDLVEPLKGLAPAIPAPTHCNADLLAVYPIGDHHHGMYAEASETGADYDCQIASSLLTGAVDHLCGGAPPAEEALLLNLGDFYHANDSSNETPGHGNRLDVDTRYGRVMNTGAMSLVHCILRLLERHKRVKVWCLRGNHDPDAAFALAMALKFYFHNEARVEVDLGSSLYKYHRFGKNLIGGHHGHGAKAADLPLIMATDRKEDWGQTEHRVWHCGHIHHRTAKEHPGCDVETHRTLAGADAWHAGKGYRSKRGMSVIIYHRELGEVQRNQFIPAMLQAA